MRELLITSDVIALLSVIIGMLSLFIFQRIKKKAQAKNVQLELWLCTTKKEVEAVLQTIYSTADQQVKFLRQQTGIVSVAPCGPTAFEDMTDNEKLEVLTNIFVMGDWRQLTNKNYAESVQHGYK